MNEVNQEKIIEFFESYEILYKLHQGNQNCFIHVLISKSKNSVVSIKVIEKIKKKSDNLFCDVKIDGNKTTMIFKLNKDKPLIKKDLEKIVGNRFSISYIGLVVKIIILNPALSDVRRTFGYLENHCRRRED